MAKVQIKKEELEAEFMAELLQYPECQNVVHVPLISTRGGPTADNWSPAEIIGTVDAAGKRRIAETWARLLNIYDMKE